METKEIVYSRKNYFHEGGPEQFQIMLDAAQEALKDVDFDTFVVIGHSGVSVSALFSAWFNKPVFILRKDEESTHDWQKYYGHMGRKWVFLDDLIDSGDTFKRVWNFICRDHHFCEKADWEGLRPYTPEFVGAYEYIQNRQKFSNADYLESCHDLV